MKRILICFFTLAVLWQKSHGQDLQTGTVFSDGQQVTAASLNNAVNSAAILPTFISGKSSVAPVSNDEFVFNQVSGGTLKKTTLSNLLSSAFANASTTGTFTIGGALAASGKISPTALSADQNDYTPTDIATSAILRLSASGANRNITGIAAQNDGTILVVRNIGTSNSIVLNNQSSSSASANRFLLPGANDITLLPNGGSSVIMYDGTLAAWVPFNLSGSSSSQPTFAALSISSNVTTWAMDANAISQNKNITLTGNTVLVMTGLSSGMTGELRVKQDATGSRKLYLHGTKLTDGSATGTTTLTSVTASWTSADVGAPIFEAGSTHIPIGTTISSFSGNNATLSATVSTGSSINFYLPNRVSKVVGAGRGAITLTTTAAATDDLAWSYDGTNVIWTYGLNAN